ncbi:hypothetical protein DL89DRAFT_265205 [Linderina pennispora]|uniref:Uncharacterized protein n=1 Tax=Linderina pennispora TaxID=61395 RepID=A0A1Y1WIX0_9FUNG|nr:uncharacterized protein DL89DRAFT_265205 [Linderina pennispora]ORX73044.1 hypothetical protein DL89DRAFT_265205 [Linderina pennispora]
MNLTNFVVTTAAILASTTPCVASLPTAGATTTSSGVPTAVAYGLEFWAQRKRDASADDAVAMHRGWDYWAQRKRDSGVRNMVAMQRGWDYWSHRKRDSSAVADADKLRGWDYFGQ